jgi:hypothetical protein
VRPPCMTMTYTLPDATWHKKQEYIWFRGGDFNNFRDIWALPILTGAGQFRMVMTYIQADATWHEKKQYKWFKGGDLNGFWDTKTLPVKGGWDHHIQPLLTLSIPSDAT